MSQLNLQTPIIWFTDSAVIGICMQTTGIRMRLLHAHSCIATGQSCSCLVWSGVLELLEGFQSMAKLDAVKRAVERHMSKFYSKFMSEINAAKKHFDLLRHNPPASPMLPKYAGAAR